MAISKLRAGSVLIVGMLILLAGCSKDTGTTPGGTASGKSTIVLDRTGGDKQVKDHVALNPDGSWTATDKSGATRTGQLPAEPTATIYQIVTGSAFAAEATKPTWEPQCIDAPANTLTVGDKKITFVDCLNGSTPPNAAAVLRVFQEKILT